MKVSDLLEVLSEYPPDLEVKVAVNPARPYVSPIRGVVQPTFGSPVFLLEDYGSKSTTLDFWSLLDD